MKALKVSLIFFLFSFLSFLLPYSSSFAASESKEQKEACDHEVDCGLTFKDRNAGPRWLEVEPFFGEYLGNHLNNSFMTGAQVGVRVTNPLTVGAEFNYARVSYDAGSDFALSGVKTRNQYMAFGFATYSFPLLQRTGKTIQELDLFVTLGLGYMNINTQSEVMGVIGGGLRTYFKPWLALRFDVNTYMYNMPTYKGGTFADDWTFTAGPAFYFLPKKQNTSK